MLVLANGVSCGTLTSQDLSVTHIYIVLIIIIINADLNGSLKDISGLLAKGSIINTICDTVANGGDLGCVLQELLPLCKEITVATKTDD